MTLVLRTDKGLPLTYEEGDANLLYLESLAKNPKAPVEKFHTENIVTSTTGIMNGTVSGASTTFPDAIALWPFSIGVDITVSTVWTSIVSTNATNTIKLLFFDNVEDDFRPGNRIGLGTTALAMNTRGNKSSPLAVNMTLEAGKVYWGGYISSASFGAVAGKSPGDFGCIRVEDGASSYSYYYGMRMDSSFADPATAFTFSSWTLNGVTAVQVPRIMFNDVS